MKLLSNIVLLIVILSSNVSAQNTCKVSVDALSGSYDGECNDGKAHGKGKASGLDTYEGQFKNGYPEGSGTYTWADKSTYTGSFKKGLMEGKGDLRYIRPGGDSVLSGYWKKNKYMGLYEKPFLVHDRTSKVNKVDVNVSDRKGKGTINLVSSQLTSATLAVNPPVPFVTDIVVIAGQYNNKNVSNLTNSSLLRVQQMIFPFRARFNFSNGETVDITFFEQSDYEVAVSFL